MSTQTHYLRIGVFVAISVALILLSIIIFGAAELIPRRKFMVETYLDDSVQGLSVGSKVKMRGVEVGYVEEIAFVERKYDLPENYVVQYAGYVMIRMAIYPDSTPRASGSLEERRIIMKEMVDSGMRMRLASAGITGQKYISVELLDPQEYPPISIVWEPRAIHIPSAPGVFDKIVGAIDKFSQKLEEIDIQPILTDLQALIHELRGDVEVLDIPALEEKIVGLLDDTRGVITGPDITEALANLRSISAKTDKLMDDIDDIVQGDEVKRTLGNIAQLTEDVKNQVPGAMEQFELTVANLNQGLRSQEDEITSAIHDLRIAFQNLRELTDMAKRYPALLLWGTEPPPANPDGE